MILCLDLATRLNGWCAGDGSKVPACDAFKLDQHGEDIGAMLAELDAKLCALMDRFSPALVCYEAPILPQNRRKGDGGAVMGSLLVRRKLMSLGSFVEYRCHMRGVSCAEAGVQAIKRELGGKSHASKDDMVAAALKCGVPLPETEAAGRKDAADAFGIWLLALRHTDKARSAEWDRRLYSSRGALF